jgi:hypothetical protein
MRPTALIAISLALASVGCRGGDTGPLTGEPPENPTTGATSSETTTGTTGMSSDETGEIACGPDQPCPDGLICAAPHQAGLLVPAGEYVCRSECIPAGATSFWCLDDSSCCGEATCDLQFGLCEGVGTDTTGADTGTDTGTESGTGTDTGTGTSTGGADEPGSTTDADPGTSTTTG